MKENKPASSSQAEQAMLRVLQAERDAEQIIRDCEAEARRFINEAQIKVQRINVHIDDRITHLEMRHAHKLDQLIRNIEKQGVAERGHDASKHYDSKRLQAVIDKLAAELCSGSTDTMALTAPGDKSDTAK
jgi:vacuolar-type H+-ATPase subunit H